MSSSHAASTAAQGAAATNTVVIVGAGLAGSLLANAFAQRGLSVEVYERREDPRKRLGAEGRSINLGLSKRGMQGLAEVGLLDTVLSRAVTMRGRAIHTHDGRVIFQAYGTDGREVLHSIDRNELNRLLIDRAAQHERVRFHFRHRFVRLDREARGIVVAAEDGGEPKLLQADLVIGADGAFSLARQELQRGSRASFSQEYLEWGYKELTIPAKPEGGSQVRLEALHVWPRAHCLAVTHPNLDGSHTLTAFIPWEGPDSFASLDTPPAVESFFRRYFADLPGLIPDLLEQWQTRPSGALLTTRTAPWHLDDWLVLVGDACHAVYPFYGQGMNSAFEDCSTLLACLDGAPGDRGAALAAYEHQRKPHVDVLVELSKRNFVELRQQIASPWFRAKKRLDLLLNRFFPRRWLPLYTMIAHTTMPYGDAEARARRQDRFLAWGAAVLAVALIAAVAALAARAGHP